MTTIAPGRWVCFFNVNPTYCKVRPHKAPFDYQYGEKKIEGACNVMEALLVGGLVGPLSGQALVLCPIMTIEARKNEDLLQEWMTSAGEQQGATVTWSPKYVLDADSGEQVIGFMLDTVQEGDRAVVEPTNGLRSISLAMIAGAVYLRALRGIQVEPLWYGELGERDKPSRLYKANHLLELIDWARDAHAFADHLHADGLMRRLGDVATGSSGGEWPKLQAALRVGDSRRTLYALRAGLRPLVNEESQFQTPPAHRRPPATRIPQEAKALVEGRLARVIEKGRQHTPDQLDRSFLDAELALIEHIADVDDLTGTTQGLREWGVNMVLWAMGVSQGWSAPSIRRQAEDWINVRLRKDPASSRFLVPAPQRWLPLIEVLAETNQLRNPLSHRGYNGNPATAPAVTAEPSPTYTDLARRWFDEASHADLRIDPPTPVARTTFLNLSNHPSAGWGEAQQAAASALAPQIVDEPFPAVDPDADTDQVVGQAEALVERLRGDGVLQTVAVALIAGEPTLCAALVERLQRESIPCLSATTRRDVRIREDGVKEARFEFVRFREWPTAKARRD